MLLTAWKIEFHGDRKMETYLHEVMNVSHKQRIILKIKENEFLKI